MAKRPSWSHLQAQWAVLSYYQRFEGLVALVLTLVIALIILVALFRLTSGVVTGLLFGVLDPLDHGDDLRHRRAPAAPLSPLTPGVHYGIPN